MTSPAVFVRGLRLMFSPLVVILAKGVRVGICRNGVVAGTQPTVPVVGFLGAGTMWTYASYVDVKGGRAAYGGRRR
jgi:hypothetical protein